MSIGDLFRRLFPARVKSSEAGGDAALREEFGSSERADIDEARIEAGGSGALGLPNEPDSHASPGEEAGEAEAR